MCSGKFFRCEHDIILKKYFNNSPLRETWWYLLELQTWGIKRIQAMSSDPNSESGPQDTGLLLFYRQSCGSRDLIRDRCQGSMLCLRQRWWLLNTLFALKKFTDFSSVLIQLEHWYFGQWYCKWDIFRSTSAVEYLKHFATRSTHFWYTNKHVLKIFWPTHFPP